MKALQLKTTEETSHGMFDDDKRPPKEKPPQGEESHPLM